MTEAELRQLIDHGSNKGPNIELPYGEIELSEPLVISDRAHFRMIGKGEEATVFMYRGDPSLPTIVLEHCLRSTLEGFGVRGNCSAGVSIRTRDPSPGWPISSDNTIKHVGVGHGATTGFYADSTAWDSNNEFHKFISCSARNCSEAGFRINGSQCHRLQFDNCIASYCGRGLWAEHGNYWTWRDGQGTQNGVDFAIGSFWIRIEIDGHRSEHSEVFLRTSPHWSVMPVSIRGVTWDGRPLDNEPIIKIQGNGPISIESSVFTSNNGKPARIEAFDHDPGCFEARGVVFVTNRAPAGDYSQMPIAVPPWFEVAQDPANMIESRTGPWAREVFKLRRTDLAGAVVVDVPQEEFRSGETVSVPWPLRPSGWDEQRSFSLFAKVTFDGPAYQPSILSAAGLRCAVWQRVDGETPADFTVDGAIRYNKGVFSPGVEYPLVLVYSRDPAYFLRTQPIPGSVMAGLGEAIKSYHRDNPIETVDHPELTFGGEGFKGTIRDVKMWDRALSVEEAKILLGHTQ